MNANKNGVKSFFVAGRPEPQARPRLGRGVFYSPKTPWWRQVYQTARLSRPKPAFDGPVNLTITLYLPRPRNTSKDIVWHRCRPYIDNFSKAIMDAMTTAGWWLDDGQVAYLSASKQYISGQQEIGAAITVSGL